MRHYEVMLILDPSLEDKDAKAAVDRFLTTVTTRGGTVGNIDHWGKRRLAYEIRHKDEGIYHLLTFEAAPDTVEEIGRVLKIDDNVMRHMAVRRVEGSSTAAPALLTPEPVAAPAPEPVAAAVVAEPEAAPVAEPEPELAPEPESEPVAEAEAEPSTESVQAAE